MNPFFLFFKLFWNLQNLLYRRHSCRIGSANASFATSETVIRIKIVKKDKSSRYLRMLVFQWREAITCIQPTFSYGRTKFQISTNHTSFKIAVLKQDCHGGCFKGGRVTQTMHHPWWQTTGSAKPNWDSIPAFSLRRYFYNTIRKVTIMIRWLVLRVCVA